MFIIVDGLDTLSSIAPIAEEPASCNIGQRAIGKGVLHLEYHQSREDVGSVLFIAGNRYFHLTDKCMAQLMAQDKQRITDHKLDVSFKFPRGHSGVVRGTREHLCGIDNS